MSDYLHTAFDIAVFCFVFVFYILLLYISITERYYSILDWHQLSPVPYPVSFMPKFSGGSVDLVSVI